MGFSMIRAFRDPLPGTSIQNGPMRGRVLNTLRGRWNMHGSRFAVAVVLLALVGQASPGRGAAGERTITRQNQAAQECGLTVDTETRQDAELGVDWVRFRITIPKDDRRLERLFSTRFILGTKG